MEQEKEFAHKVKNLIYYERTIAQKGILIIILLAIVLIYPAQFIYDSTLIVKDDYIHKGRHEEKEK